MLWKTAKRIIHRGFCEAFKRLPVTKRKELIAKSGRCFRCLGEVITVEDVLELCPAVLRLQECHS